MSITFADVNLGSVQDIDTIGMQSDGEPPLELFRTDFANREFATVIPRSVFINGRAAAPARLTLPEQRLQDAPVLMASPQIAPGSAQRVADAVNKPANAPADRVIVRRPATKRASRYERRCNRAVARRRLSFAAHTCTPRPTPAHRAAAR